MTYDELLAELDKRIEFTHELGGYHPEQHALRAVVDLHKPWYRPGVTGNYPLCKNCYTYEGSKISYPCSTIQAIEKELG
jgi:hypothetical protein